MNFNVKNNNNNYNNNNNFNKKIHNKNKIGLANNKI